MFEKMRNICKRLFFMNEKEYAETLLYYADKFGLKEQWAISVVEKLPKVKLNCDTSKALAFTEWETRRVVFKEEIFEKFKFLTRAYIRHEIRHCSQMEVIHDVLSTRYGEASSSYYTSMIIAFDNSNGYGKSLMEADAWLATFGIIMDINKVATKIIKRNLPFLN